MSILRCPGWTDGTHGLTSRCSTETCLCLCATRSCTASQTRASPFILQALCGGQFLCPCVCVHIPGERALAVVRSTAAFVVVAGLAYHPRPMLDKIFKAYDVRATYPNPLNEEAAWKVGHATAQFLKRSRQSVSPDQRVKLEDTLVVGYDMRPHSPLLTKALTDGIRSTGMNVIEVGMVDTSFI